MDSWLICAMYMVQIMITLNFILMSYIRMNLGQMKILNLDIDKMGGNSTTNTKSQALINDWMDDNELVDIWRFHHPDSRVYSWHKKRPTPIFCRLDFFLVPFGISGKIKSSNISPGFRSDQSLILIDLIPFETKRGKCFWKMNCSHLRDKEYVDLNKNTIKPQMK